MTTPDPEQLHQMARAHGLDPNHPGLAGFARAVLADDTPRATRAEVARWTATASAAELRRMAGVALREAGRATVQTDWQAAALAVCQAVVGANGRGGQMESALRMAKTEIRALTRACGEGLMTQPTLQAIDAALGDADGQERNGRG